jgi:nucleoside-diphosphate-sugar epimerase
MPNRNNVQPKTAFVTGANGFLGAFLVDFLLGQGNQVIALVRGYNPTEKLAKALREVMTKGPLNHGAGRNSKSLGEIFEFQVLDSKKKHLAGL